MSASCALRSLDLSNTGVDVWSLLQSLRANQSLRSIDLRRVPGVPVGQGPTHSENLAPRGGSVSPPQPKPRSES